MKTIINAIAITPAGTIKSGWISHSETPKKAQARISHWTRDIINGAYEQWGGQRTEWVTEMKKSGYKIAFYTYLMLDEGMTFVDYNKVA